jgi:hypothetical protein
MTCPSHSSRSSHPSHSATAEGPPNPEPRTSNPIADLSSALDKAASTVDWPAFNARLSARLSSVEPHGRSPWVIAAVGVRLAAAGVLLAAGIAFGARCLVPPPAAQGPAMPIVARPPSLVRPNDIEALLAQLPAGGADEAWIESRVRAPI